MMPLVLILLSIIVVLLAVCATLLLWNLEAHYYRDHSQPAVVYGKRRKYHV